MPSDNEILRNIAEYSLITGLPASKIRYYEKLGLKGVLRSENGYRSFNRDSIYHLNDMKALCARGFSIKESLNLTNDACTAHEMIDLLAEKEAELSHELLIMKAMRAWAEETRNTLEQLEKQGSLLFQSEMEDQIFLPACVNADFSIGIKNGRVREQWNHFYPINRQVGVLDSPHSTELQYINYGDIVSVSEFERYHFAEDPTLRRLPMGRCLCFNFQENEDGLFALNDYPQVLQYLKEHHLEISVSIILTYFFMIFTERNNNDGIAFLPVREKQNH
ncbi:MAG: MerR family transcriptional regulator [Eubacteriales bacterium]|nr:MerR family transcriptional regulator [Eubacteriales bacterium]